MLFNIINGQAVPVSNDLESTERFTVKNPATGDIINEFSSTPIPEIDEALAGALSAFDTWRRSTFKQRAQIFFRFRYLCLEKYKNELIELIVRENGKHRTDATASLLKGLETCEYALSPILGSGTIQEVSGGISCQDRRDPIGVVVSICPFNFPAMVPMWTCPILAVCGNCVVIKPSEKVPFTIVRMVEIMKEAGLPDGVVSVINGGKSVVTHLINHPSVAGVTFVGSSPVAEVVYNQAVNNNKRALCLGGAKNHLVVMPDADPEQSSTDILNSFAGSSGQRCMAASVLVLVGEGNHQVLDKVIEKARAIKPGQSGSGEIGPVIDRAALERITKYVSESVTLYGSKLLVDGREWTTETKGFWFGPTIIDHDEKHYNADPALRDEIFGPVVSVVRVNTLQEAIMMINKSSFGNAACIYTRSGPAVDLFTKSVDPGMIGVNVGVPVPREPFSFGGTKRSKFGIGDITGDGLVEFGTIRRKITVKWGGAINGDFVSRNFTG
jgi:malonate-semialdehyde dehydrogenase (acetylating)/methylmalonate-semialdehyde dehydrogenase